MQTIDSWSEQASAARLHFVSGKGGTGKTTVAAALALALAAAGRKVLLAEVEGRQGIAQLLGLPPLPYAETPVAVMESGGSVAAQPIDVEAAFLEYLDTHYKVGFAAKGLKKVGAVEFATGLAPGLRDVILTGKLEELVLRANPDGTPAYDAIVVDAPPTGRIGKFLDVTKAMASLADSGPIRAQTQSIVELMHSDKTQVHLVTLLEALPVQETLDAVDELTGLGLRIGAIIVNQADEVLLPEPALAAAASTTGAALRESLRRTGLTLPDEDIDGLAQEVAAHAERARSQRHSDTELATLGTNALRLPTLRGGVDPDALYDLANLLTDQGVR